MIEMDTIFKESIRIKKPYMYKHSQTDVKLNQNENPYDVPVSMKSEILEKVRNTPWNRYPSINSQKLRKMLSIYTGVPEESIITGVGSNELLLAVSGLVLNPKKTAMIIEPTFQIYEQCISIFEGNIVRLLLEQNLSYPSDEIITRIREQKIDFLYIASPNNPTGGLIDPEVIIGILEIINGLVILDEAYYEFSGITAISLLSRFPNLVITRTFSKAFGLAGLRIGYILASPYIIDSLHKIKLPFSMNIFSEITAIHLLRHPEIIEERVEKINNEKKRMVRELMKVPSIKVIPSEANFFLINFYKSGRDVFNRFAERGIAVRDVSAYPLLENCIRVTVGTHDENNIFLDAMRKLNL